jgi:hypothetical protein
MICKLTEMVEDVLEKNKKMEDFVIVVKGKQYDVHVTNVRRLLKGKFKQLRIHVVESKTLE